MSEAANPEGADARSPEAIRVHCDKVCAEAPGPLICDGHFAEVLRAAESRGAKAGRAEAAEYLERCAQDMRMRGAPWTGFGLLVMHAQRIRSLSAEGATPSGSPSVPAAQHQPDRGTLTERPAWAQLVDGALALLEPAERRARQVSQTVVGPSVVQIGAATFLVAVDSLRDALSRAQPRAAPSDSAPATPGLGPPLDAKERTARIIAEYAHGRLPPSLGELLAREIREAEATATARLRDLLRAFERHVIGYGRTCGCAVCRAVMEATSAPSSPESPAVAADAGDRNHE